MKENQTREYIVLLENNLSLMQQRHDFMQRVQEYYGTHRADVFIKNIESLEKLIEENNQKINNLKKDR